MQEKQNTLLNRETLKFKAVTNEIEISNSGKLICTLIGVSLIPVQFRIEPLEIKNNLIKKSKENQIDLQNQLFKGQYYVNVLDYTLGEITFAANLICGKWAEHIWKYLISEPEKFQPQITLTSDAIREQVLKANPTLFSSLTEIDNFCNQYNISVDDFVQPAKFSQLEIELEAISARLSSEIFFFRKKLFAELFIQYFESKIYNFEQIESNTIHSKNKEIYSSWKSNQLKEIEMVQKYIKSPFTFEDSEQYSNYRTIKNFSPHKELQQDLITETFYWIDNFEKAKERFERAVELYKTDNDKRDSLDNLRLTLELVLKGVLKNEKSLENQKSEIGVYQKQLGIGAEFRNTFITTFNYFNKYQNKNVKHNSNIENIHEVEFIFGLVMIFIRMLIKPNKELNN